MMQDIKKKIIKTITGEALKNSDGWILVEASENNRNLEISPHSSEYLSVEMRKNISFQFTDAMFAGDLIPISLEEALSQLRLAIDHLETAYGNIQARLQREEGE